VAFFGLGLCHAKMISRRRQEIQLFDQE
jgi:hypothetical protein